MSHPMVTPPDTDTDAVLNTGYSVTICLNKIWRPKCVLEFPIFKNMLKWVFYTEQRISIISKLIV